MVSKFAKYKLSGLPRVDYNVGVLPQA